MVLEEFLGTAAAVLLDANAPVEVRAWKGEGLEAPKVSMEGPDSGMFSAVAMLVCDMLERVSGGDKEKLESQYCLMYKATAETLGIKNVRDVRKEIKLTDEELMILEKIVGGTIL